MTELGRHGKKTYQNRFVSWSEATEAAGLQKRPDREARSRDELLGELERIAGKLGNTPSSRGVQEMGEIAVNTYKNEFGSWRKVLKAAGLDRE